MGEDTKPLTDLPSDILLQIFTQCDVLDILSLSSTCKQLQRAADEHQVWLHQARRLEIPIPPGTTPPKAELKDWVISRTRVDVCWIKRRPEDLVLYSFETDTEFVDSYLIPGGEFVAFLYKDGDVGLNRIEKSEATGELNLREVARCKEPNAQNYPYYWSRLITETPYGCPMILVSAGDADLDDPSVFLIDPVSQTIEKKRYIRCTYEDPDFFIKCRITALRDRVFFICEAVAKMQITVVAGSGRDQAIGRFNLSLPNDDGYYFDVRVFFVSENSFVAGTHVGIHLYHIPELGTVDDTPHLDPIWSWWASSGGLSGYHGTFYKTASPYPALWLQGEQTTHILEFGVEESGCFPVVTNHHITQGQPAYYVERHLKLQGRKAMGTEVKQDGEAVFKTGVLGKPDLARELRTSLPGMWDGHRFESDEVKYTDLDEATGRIMVVIGTVPDLSGTFSYVGSRCLENKGEGFVKSLTAEIGGWRENARSWTDIPVICSDKGGKVRPLSGYFFTISVHVDIAEMRASEVDPSLAWVQSCVSDALPGKLVSALEDVIDEVDDESLETAPSTFPSS